MVPAQVYKKFLTEFVRRHMVIFGTNIAREIANSTRGIEVDETGEVLKVVGHPLAELQILVSKYQELSEPVVFLQLKLLLDKYPDIFLEYNQPIPNVRLSCELITHIK